MKIIAFGDIHMAAAAARQIPGVSDADLLVLTGDLTNFGGKTEIKQVLDTVLQLNPNVMALFGNMDREEVNQYLENFGLNLHGQAHLFRDEVCLVGVGGSNFTPFHTPSEFPERELAAFADSGFIQARDYVDLAQPLYQRKIPTLFFSHAPPHGTAIDRLPNGRHVGSTAIRRAIEKYQPNCCISGHIHEARGTDTIGRTRLYNPGMLRSGGWVTIHIHHAELDCTLS